MGSWAYCDCGDGDIGIGPPTMLDAFAGVIACNQCGWEKDLDQYDKLTALDDHIISVMEEHAENQRISLLNTGA